MSTPRTIASLGTIRRISGEINRMRSDADAGLAAALVRVEPVHQGAWRWQAVRQHVQIGSATVVPVMTAIMLDVDFTNSPAVLVEPAPPRPSTRTRTVIVRNSEAGATMFDWSEMWQRPVLVLLVALRQRRQPGRRLDDREHRGTARARTGDT